MAAAKAAVSDAKRQRPTSYQCRHWLLTIPAFDNISMDDIDKYGPLTFDHNDLTATVDDKLATALHIRYICGQLETPEDDDDEDDSNGYGYPHYQVFVSFGNGRTMGGIKDIFECTAIHCEQVHQDNGASAYCLKDDTSHGFRFEYGVRRNVAKGERNDVYDMYDTLNKTESMRATVLAHPAEAIKFIRGLQTVASIITVPTERPSPTIIWFMGPTGSGKSYSARKLIAEKGWRVYYRNPEMGHWWDNYDGEDTIFFDDFNDEDRKKDVLSVDPFLRLLSETPYTSEIKGGTVHIKAHRFIFTTEFGFNKYFETSDKYQHWLRRFATAKEKNRLTIKRCEYVPVGNLPDVNPDEEVQGDL